MSNNFFIHFLLINFNRVLRMQNAATSPATPDQLSDDASAIGILLGNGNEGEQEQNDEGEGEEDELVEPRFRYKRILGDLMRLLENDAASAFAVHEKLLVVGFQSGRVCVFDHMGNVHLDSCSRHHKCAVVAVSVDQSANYILSCANDFTLVIFGIGCADFNQQIPLKTSAKAVAIAPDFSRPGSGQRLLAAAHDLVLYERGVRAEFFSGKRRETVLFRGREKDGSISCLSWHKSLVAFTNETGTRVFDMRISRCITLVQPVHKLEQYPSAKFPPKHTWLDSSTLAIGWACSVCICGIFQSSRRESKVASELFENVVPARRYGQILHRFWLPDFLIAGISFASSTTTSSSSSDQQNVPMPISSPPSTASLANFSLSGHVQSSPNASSRDLQAMASPPPGQQAQMPKIGRNWSELVLFGMKREGSGEPSMDQASLLSSSISTSMQDEPNTSTSAIAYSTQLQLLRPLSLQEYFLEAEDTIEMRGTAHPKLLSRFTLGALPQDNVFFILGPREAIEAIPCSIDNRLNWLMENGLFEEAFESATKNVELLREHSLLDVGKRLVNHLIEQGSFEAAASYLPEVCARRKEEWMFYVNEFERRNQVLKLVPVVPTKEPQLEPENYESILVAALHARPRLFHAIVCHWDADIYRAGSIVAKVIERISVDNGNKSTTRLNGTGTPKQSGEEPQQLSDQDRLFLLRALASLLLQCRKYAEAITTFLLVSDPAIFGVIERHKLFPYVKDRILELMEINQDLAIRLLLDNEDIVSHEKVVGLLGNQPKIQLAYLHRLQARGEGAIYSDRLVKLYAEHDRPALLPFLRRNEHYRLDLALDVCRRRDFIEEVVYLLGRSGNRLDALDLMVNKLLRVDMAIDFCAETDDPELWARLVESAQRRPEQCRVLLRRMASINVSSLDVVKKIPPQMDIPQLRQCLLQVLHDHEQQRDLLRHSKNVATADITHLLGQQLNSLAIVSSSSSEGKQEQKCGICHSNLLTGSSTTARNDVLLLSADGGELFHEQCVQLQKMQQLRKQ